MDLPTILRSAGAREPFDGRKPPALHVPQALPPSAFRIPHSALPRRISFGQFGQFGQLLRNSALRRTIRTIAQQLYAKEESAFRLPHSAFLLNRDEGEAEPAAVVPVVRVAGAPEP